MTVHPEQSDATVSFRKVQRLRDTIDRVVTARACCTSNLEVVQKLKHNLFRVGDIDMEPQETILKDFINSADALQSRIRNAIDLVGYTLTLHQQLETAKVDKELRDMTRNLGLVTEEMKSLTEDMKNLTQDTVDDSTTVKIITFVSAVYLPGSFVGTLYGMNFFAFDTVSKNIIIARDFWIFIATWLPLTLITGALYMAVLYFDRRAKGKQIRWPWTSKRNTNREKSI